MIRGPDKEKKIILLQSEIELIIEELERTEQNVFSFLNYQKIIDKLNMAKTK